VYFSHSNQTSEMNFECIKVFFNHNFAYINEWKDLIRRVAAFDASFCHMCAPIMNCGVEHGCFRTLAIIFISIDIDRVGLVCRGCWSVLVLCCCRYQSSSLAALGHGHFICHVLPSAIVATLPPPEVLMTHCRRGEAIVLLPPDVMVNASFFQGGKSPPAVGEGMHNMRHRVSNSPSTWSLAYYELK
jgi:hypothetical protein